MKTIISVILGVRKVTVEDMAKFLTDRDSSSLLTFEEIKWMKETPVINVTLGNDYLKDSSPFFDLLVDGNSKLRISSRSTNNGEFRGDVVRKAIKTAQSTCDPNLTVYDSLQAYISNLSNNGDFIYVTSAVIDTYLKNKFGFNPTSPIFKFLRQKLRNRVNAFGQSVFRASNESGFLWEENGDITDEAQRFSQEILKKTLDYKLIPQDLFDFLNAFKNFETQLRTLNHKLLSLKKGTEAQKAGEELATQLYGAREKLLAGRVSISQFKLSCETACEKAEDSALKEHRGWKQVFANILFAVVSIVSRATANIISWIVTGSFDFPKTNTDSINKIHKLKHRLREIHSVDEGQDDIMAPSVGI